MTINGIHHVTAITGDGQKNVDFYTGVLGLRLVKVTVNYDDPTTYHLYFGDGLGRPGTIMTFFVWPGRQGRAGTGQVIETAYAVPVGSLNWWEAHLREAGVTVERVRVFDEERLRLSDPDGLVLTLVEAADARAENAWEKGGVPAEYAIRGFHGVTLGETDEKLPASVLVERFGYHETAREGKRVRYEAPGGELARVVEVEVTGERVLPRFGGGQVHHVAFRTPGDAEQVAWQELLWKDGRNVSPVMDRNYFHSIYFREPGGTLFEIATNGPGMTIDEPAERLGSKLILPAWAEEQRAAIERALPPLRLQEILQPDDNVYTMYSVQKGSGCMKNAVQKWGNSLGLRIPSAIAAEMGIKRGTPVNLRLEEDGALIVRVARRPRRRSRHKLADLVARITPENLEPTYDWGPDVGREIV